MSVPPDFMTGLGQAIQNMGGGLLQAAPAPQGGLMGAINAALMSPTASLGLGLMGNTSGATAPGAALAQGLQNGQQLQQRNTSQWLQNAQGLLSLQNQVALQNLFNRRPQGSDPTQNAQGGQDQSTSAGFGAAPAGAYDTSAGPALPARASLSSAVPPGAPQPGLADISQIPIAGMSPDLYRRMAMLRGNYSLDTEKEIRDYQLQTAKMRVQPQIDALDNVIESDRPAQYVGSDPQLQRLWTRMAPALGFDLGQPNTFSDDNVRRVFGSVRNQLAAQAQLPTKAPPVPLSQMAGELGSMYSRNPITGEIKQEKAPEDTAQFMLPDGSVRMLTKAEGIRRGLTPFNPTIWGAANMSDQAVQMAADTYRTTGKFPAGMSRNPAMQAKVWGRIASDATANGDTTGAIAARQEALKANGAALAQVSKLETATNGYAATLDKNLTNLEQAYAKAGNMGSPLLTRAQRYWQQGVTGDPDTASMVTWLNAVQGEYAKLKSGNLGNAPASDSQMRDAKEVINKYMNQGGIAAVAQAMRLEAGNRQAAIAQQRQSLMGQLGQSAPGAPAGTPRRSNSGQPVRITSDDDYNQLPSGTQFVAPDGTTRRKP